MVTAEILKPCVVCCQAGSIVTVTELQFGCLGDAARRLDDDATARLAEGPKETPDAPEISETTEVAENPDDAPEISESAAEVSENSDDATKKKSGRGKKAS